MTTDYAKFFSHVRSQLNSLKQAQVDGFNTVLRAVAGSPLAFASYMLATAWHETNGTMQPVEEAYWMSDAWRKRYLRYYPWHGRGYVQLTWEENYHKADIECTRANLIKSGELLADPDLAMRADIAAYIMRKGMEEGWFAGDSRGRFTLKRCLPTNGVATRIQYIDARRIINGKDKADLIEDYAQIFEKALWTAGYQP